MNYSTQSNQMTDILQVVSSSQQLNKKKRFEINIDNILNERADQTFEFGQHVYRQSPKVANSKLKFKNEILFRQKKEIMSSREPLQNIEYEESKLKMQKWRNMAPKQMIQNLNLFMSPTTRSRHEIPTSRTINKTRKNESTFSIMSHDHQLRGPTLSPSKKRSKRIIEIISSKNMEKPNLIPTSSMKFEEEEQFKKMNSKQIDMLSQKQDIIRKFNVSKKQNDSPKQRYNEDISNVSPRTASGIQNPVIKHKKGKFSPANSSKNPFKKISEPSQVMIQAKKKFEYIREEPKQKEKLVRIKKPQNLPKITDHLFKRIDVPQLANDDLYDQVKIQDNLKMDFSTTNECISQYCDDQSKDSDRSYQQSPLFLQTHQQIETSKLKGLNMKQNNIYQHMRTQYRFKTNENGNQSNANSPRNAQNLINQSQLKTVQSLEDALINQRIRNEDKYGVLSMVMKPSNYMHDVIHRNVKQKFTSRDTALGILEQAEQLQLSKQKISEIKMPELRVSSIGKSRNTQLEEKRLCSNIKQKQSVKLQSINHKKCLSHLETYTKNASNVLREHPSTKNSLASLKLKTGHNKTRKQLLSLQNLLGIKEAEEQKLNQSQKINISNLKEYSAHQLTARILKVPTRQSINEQFKQISKNIGNQMI